ncbi:MAG: ParB N-terminal domain-containing protein [Candidatus Bathyarchaeia archaeon]
MTAFASRALDFSQTDLQPQLTLIHIDQLKEHEGVDPGYLESLRAEIESDGILRMPIAVDRDTNTIIDGHHRLHALKHLCCKRIPVVFINYRSPDVAVTTWRDGEEVTKDSVLDAALGGRRLRPKTSKHLVLLNGVFEHISVIEKEVNVPLESLR